MFERIDMAVFATVPGYLRVSLLVDGLHLAGQPLAAAGLLAAMGRRAANEPARGGSTARWQEAYADLGLAVATPPQAVLAAWAAQPAGVPSQGPLADVVNAFSLQHAVPTAAYDIDAVEGGLWLRPSRGCEHYFDFASERPESPAIGEIILADSADQVLARAWHGEQGRPFAVTAATRRALVHVDLIPPLSDDAERLADQLARLIAAYAATTVRRRQLDWDSPQVEWGDDRG